MQRRCVFFLPALLLSGIVASAQQPTTTITSVDELVRAGITNNRDLASARARIDEARGQVRQAGVRPAANLDLTGATGEPLGTTAEDQYGAGISQTLEIFGKRGKRIRVAETAMSADEADWEDRASQLALQIRTSFADLQAQRQKLRVLDQLLDLNRESFRLTEARVKEGDVAPLEASLLQVEISRSEVMRASAQGRLHSDEAEVRRLTGIGPSTALPDFDTISSVDVEATELTHRALADRPDLRSARLVQQREIAGVSLAKAEAKPDVTVSAGYSRQNSQFDGLYGFTSSGAISPIRDRVDTLNFGVSIPLRTPRSGAGNVQSASARATGAKAHVEYLEQTIPIEVDSAYQRWKTALSSVSTMQSGVIGPSQSNLKIIQEAYKAGQLRLLDVLNQQRQLVDAQLALIDAQADASRSWAELEHAVGGDLP
ncbi:MAG: TolC family protein [Acidobacteria bacterium]|nr:TolC family protein [Acidobacteriota bacterium]